jgi:hypothetical protein
MIHTELPIYQTGQKLAQLAYQAQQNMPRGFKRTLGEHIAARCMDMLNHMAMANAVKGQSRADHVNAILANKEAAQVMLRVAHDLRLISPKIWGDSVLLLGSIGKQAGGWLKKTTHRTAPAV